MLRSVQAAAPSLRAQSAFLEMARFGMKTYRNKDLGFEIDVPEEWPRPIRDASGSLIFVHGSHEAFNIIVGFRLPERLLEYTEFEFRQYAQSRGYTDLEFGRILVGGRDHVWARYNMGSGAWSRKYMIVFGGIEYAITATCFDLPTLAERERIWDAIVKSFTLSKQREQDIVTLKAGRSRIAGDLYERAYEAAGEGHYAEACRLLEQCLSENPNHILAHKELAFVLKNMGDVRGALPHRQEVKRLDPSDKVNRFNLAGLLALLEAREDALREVEELLTMEPGNPGFLEFRRVLVGSSLTHPQHYDEESRLQPGRKCNLKLIHSIVPDSPHVTHLMLLYQWDKNLPDEEEKNLALRTIAYVSCAIYDAAMSAGLSCQPSPISNGRRPAWILEGEKSTVSLVLSEVNESEKTCAMTIGAMLTAIHEPPSDRARWEKLHAAFKARFSNICV